MMRNDHSDPARLYYNTGNKRNTEHRSGICMKNQNCDLENAPPDSIHSRYKYFKRKDINPDFSSLNPPNLLLSSRYIQVNSWMFDFTSSKILKTSSGLTICRNLFSKEVLHKLAEEAVFNYTTVTDSRNNLNNVGRTLIDKVESWSNVSLLKLGIGRCQIVYWSRVTVTQRSLPESSQETSSQGIEMGYAWSTSQLVGNHSGYQNISHPCPIFPGRISRLYRTCPWIWFSPRREYYQFLSSAQFFHWDPQRWYWLPSSANYDNFVGMSWAFPNW